MALPRTAAARPVARTPAAAKAKTQREGAGTGSSAAPIEVSVTRGEALTSLRVDGRAATWHSTAGRAGGVLAVSPAAVAALRAAVVQALADPDPRSGCLGDQVLVTASLGSTTRTAALCSDAPRRNDAGWRALIRLMRGMLQSGRKPAR